MFFETIITILSSFLVLKRFFRLVNVFCIVFCIEIEQLNVGCNEIQLNIVAKI